MYADPFIALLISGDELEANLGKAGLVVIDARSAGYEAGHIPGAVSIKWSDYVDEVSNLKPLADLEAQLNTVLPQRYRSWMDERSQRLAELASTSCHHLKQFERMQQTCVAERATPCPKIGKLVTLETMLGRCGPATVE